MELLKKKFFIFLVLMCFFSYLSNVILKTRKETISTYNFKITKIKLSTTKSLILYKDDLEITLWNYNIRESDNIRIGDVIYKESCTKYLIIFKIIDGKKVFHKKIAPSGLIPYDLFCNN